MTQDVIDEIEALTDRMYALEFAFLAFAHAAHDAGAVSHSQVAHELQRVIRHIRTKDARLPADDLANMSPVADALESLRDGLGNLL